MLYDVFVCHASEDKDSLVRPLAEELRAQRVEVWYDEFSLHLGDSLRAAIDLGLGQSRFGVVILSDAFFAKNWPQYELDGLLEREMSGDARVLLPVWHGVTHGDVMLRSPALAGRKASLSSRGLDSIVQDILDVIRPQGSPLIRARDMLLVRGLSPPVVTDEYWLDVVEASNRVPGAGGWVPPESAWGRWSFPLPWERDERIAWTAMQLQWVEAAEETPITPLTRPPRVLEFIESHAGLVEACSEYPHYLAEYAPQVTVPGFGGVLEDVIESAYQHELAHGKADDEWAVRQFMNESTHDDDGEMDFLAGSYFSGGIFGPEVSPYKHSEHLIWLLSRDSEWLPQSLRNALTEGMAEWGVWPWTDTQHLDDAKRLRDDALLNSMFDAAKHGVPFAWTPEAEEDVRARIHWTSEFLHLEDDPTVIFQRFVAQHFPERYVADRLRGRSGEDRP